MSKSISQKRSQVGTSSVVIHKKSISADASTRKKSVISSPTIVLARKKEIWLLTIVCICNFIERLNYFAMRGIAVYYMDQVLEIKHTALVHNAFLALHFTSYAIGGIIADGEIGQRNVCLMFTCMSLAGTTLVILASVMESIKFYAFFVGLLIYYVGLGAARCSLWFIGTDHFSIPDQLVSLRILLYSLYFFGHIGGFISRAAGPYLAAINSCFGRKDCFALPFLGGFILQLVLVIILGMTNIPKTKIVKKHLPCRILSCISHALTIKCSLTRKGTERWMDNSISKYGARTVDKARRILRIMMLTLPLIIHFYFFFQKLGLAKKLAGKMSGNILSFIIKPAVIGTMNSLLNLIVVPANLLLHHQLAKLGFNNCVKRITISLSITCITSVSFYILTTIVSRQEIPVIERGYFNVRFYNPTSCDFTLLSEEISMQEIYLPSMSCATYRNVMYSRDLTFHYSLKYDFCPHIYDSVGIFYVKQKKANGFYFSFGKIVQVLDKEQKSVDGSPVVRVISVVRDRLTKTFPVYQGSSLTSISLDKVNFTKWEPGVYNFPGIGSERFEVGGVYSLLIHLTEESQLAKYNCVITDPNSVNMCWLLLTFVSLSFSQTLVAMNVLELAYVYAPKQLRTTCYGFCFLAAAFGNYLTVIVNAVFTDRFQLLAFFDIIVIILALVLQVVLTTHWEDMDLLPIQI